MSSYIYQSKIGFIGLWLCVLSSASNNKIMFLRIHVMCSRPVILTSCFTRDWTPIFNMPEELNWNGGCMCFYKMNRFFCPGRERERERKRGTELSLFYACSPDLLSLYNIRNIFREKINFWTDTCQESEKWAMYVSIHSLGHNTIWTCR